MVGRGHAGFWEFKKKNNTKESAELITAIQAAFGQETAGWLSAIEENPLQATVALAREPVWIQISEL